MDKEELKNMELEFENLFNQRDTVEGLEYIKEAIRYYKERGADVSKYKKRYYQAFQEKYSEVNLN